MAPKKHPIEEAKPERFYALFCEATDKIGELFIRIAERAKARPDEPIDIALTIASTIGYRQLRVARLLFDAGFAPETRSLVRGAWESMVDMSYLLQGGGRQERCRKYVAMMILRYPKLLTINGTGPPPEFISILDKLGYPEAVRDFGNDPGVKREHWSGLPKQDVRKAAAKFLESEGNLPHLNKRGRAYIAGLVDKTREGIFNTGSTVVHSDPAAYWLMMPHTPDLADRANAHPGRLGGPEPSIACTAATLMSIPLARRLRSIEVAHALTTKLHQLLIRGLSK